MATVDTTSAVIQGQKLLQAAIANDLETVQALLKQHAEDIARLQQDRKNTADADEDDDEFFAKHDIVNVPDEHSRTALFHACAAGHAQVAEALLKSGRARIDMYDVDGMAPIHVAVRNNKIDMVRMLLSLGQDKREQTNLPCACAPYVGYTPLHFACCFFKTQTLETIATMLITEYEASVDACTEDSETPLHICARHNVTSIASVLLDNGANINAPNKTGVTPLMISANLAHEEMVDLILEHAKARELKLNAVDTLHGDSALHFAFQAQLQRVLPNGMDISPQHEQIAYKLVYAGVNPSTRSKDGCLATDFCSEAFKTILNTISQSQFSWPPHLEVLLMLPEQRLQSSCSSTEMDSTACKEFISAVTEFKNERAEAAMETSKRGSCPFISGNKNRLNSKAKKEQQQNGALPSRKPPMMVNNPFFQMFGPKLQEDAQDVPMEHDQDNASQDASATGESKCPFGYRAASTTGKQSILSGNAASKSVPVVTSVSSTTSTTGKCPIPFHNQLKYMMTPSFWIIVILSVLLWKYGKFQ